MTRKVPVNVLFLCMCVFERDRERDWEKTREGTEIENSPKYKTKIKHTFCYCPSHAHSQNWNDRTVWLRICSLCLRCNTPLRRNVMLRRNFDHLSDIHPKVRYCAPKIPKSNSVVCDQRSNPNEHCFQPHYQRDLSYHSKVTQSNVQRCPYLCSSAKSKLSFRKTSSVHWCDFLVIVSVYGVAQKKWNSIDILKHSL